MNEKSDSIRSALSDTDTVGCVYLIGAGPGDAGLITVRGLELIRQADVVVYDALANPVLLEEARDDAALIDAGKRAREHTLTQDQTNALLAEHALAGRTVARLKGGDPYVFGRGGEEAIYLHERGVRVQVVPGVTSAIAGPAAMGVPVTHRRIACTVTFITGHEDPQKQDTQIDYAGLASLARQGGTLCFYMSMGRLQIIVDELTQHGLPADTPAAVVQWGTLPKQRSTRATLGTLTVEVERAKLGPPSIVVIGPVAALDDDALNWFEQRPLFGQTIVVTRTRQQASGLSQQLTELGAHVIEAPTITIDPPDDWSQVDDALRRVHDFDWLVLTSANSVEQLRNRLRAIEQDARYLAGVHIAAVGDATAAALTGMGIDADLVPTEFVAESLAAKLIAEHDVATRRLLLLRTDIARPGLVKTLTAAGADVTDLSIYRTRPADALPEALLEALRDRNVDWVTFTSSSTITNFLDLLGDERDLLRDVRIASIGPITSRTARDLDLPPTVEPDVHTVASLVNAICQHPRSIPEHRM